jgi:hypothetical protein
LSSAQLTRGSLAHRVASALATSIPEARQHPKTETFSLPREGFAGLGNDHKLSEQNNGFAGFIQDVRIDFESKKIHRSEFDEVLKDIRIYIRAN